jgi:hypothetical protein
MEVVAGRQYSGLGQIFHKGELTLQVKIMI